MRFEALIKLLKIQVA